MAVYLEVIIPKLVFGDSFEQHFLAAFIFCIPGQLGICMQHGSYAHLWRFISSGHSSGSLSDFPLAEVFWIRHVAKVKPASTSANLDTMHYINMVCCMKRMQKELLLLWLEPRNLLAGTLDVAAGPSLVTILHLSDQLPIGQSRNTEIIVMEVLGEDKEKRKFLLGTSQAGWVLKLHPIAFIVQVSGSSYITAFGYCIIIA